MKKYKITFIVLLLTLVGCSDLEENPVGILAPESFFKTTADLQAAINGSYASMSTESFWGRKLTLTLLLRGDLADIGDQGTSGRRKEVNNFTMGDDNGMVSAFWPQAYAIIGTANQAISNAGLINDDENKVNAVAAQAYFCRAFTYYHLVRLFGDIPYIDFAVSDASEIDAISKTPENEVYEGIIADLQYAKEWLPDTQFSRALPSKATAAAYLASVYLTRGDFQKAAEEAQFVINNEARFDLRLEPDFQNLFDANQTAGLKEPLFTIDYMGQISSSGYGQDYVASVTGIRGDATHEYGEGWSVAVPSLKVYQDWDAKDYRRAVSLDTTATSKSGEVYPYTQFEEYSDLAVNRPHIAKYYRYAGLAGNNGRESSTNYIPMRYAEVLLIAAEALNEISAGSSEAVSYVNRLRERARLGSGSMHPLNISEGLLQDELRNIIIEERKIELAFEFKRWYDIKRLKLGNEVFGPNGLEPQPNFDANRDYLLPLPGPELVRNSNLMPNNPGY
ncbi:SusD-like protein [Formosa agariphila KMM 3901]|uniref:SusD-like protein P2 n=1 Tax=Formosa agariphila (strain DSM 15362 / KCTC 12365 / LMG 23005 / KMM 3901 / M-2Alg 35-1) TaxID=1347342 RepID=PLH2_FORAG|nr:RagB/SusD family nutrient uptake outer membrane protein [Formosa agariphila]T2KN63.1 RecName: Full=SusD-like protein P2; Short=P2_SusD; AltName: Full=Polysaccharide utilization locus H protein P2; Short=PUL H protein P2; Flags: Precursor [Formosa agariphila KMM 3901]CDF79903.1 SusD-like protein [Formosa agariphila KMM 3901]